MKHELPAELLSALGVTPEKLGEPEVFEMESQQVGHGRAATSLRSIEEALEQVDWIRLVSLGADAHQLQVSADPDVASRFLLEDLSERGIDCQVVPASAGGVLQDGGAVCFDMQGLSGVSVRNAEGERVVLRYNGQHLVLYPIWENALEPEPLVTLTSNLGEWLEETDDAWLVDHLVELSKHNNPWSQACAVGLYGRLRVETTERAQSVLDALLSGAADPAFDRPWRWAAQLSEPQLQTLQRLLSLEVRQAMDWVETLWESRAPYDATWVADLRALLYRREELQAAVAVLAAAGVDEPNPLLEALDRSGARLVHALPKMDAFTADERLRRSAALEESWWTLLAVEPR